MVPSLFAGTKGGGGRGEGGGQRAKGTRRSPLRKERKEVHEGTTNLYHSRLKGISQEEGNKFVKEEYLQRTWKASC
ncbi:unnamed protein product [Prunus armeniaca]|uniref:Uncharacterized protein n=1 Tax=Prunus armeniaca TaxID=36596 RepID=A0A6J5UI27_PRUAR|nr:unnamed protein product [Prunus armeniaca]